MSSRWCIAAPRGRVQVREAWAQRKVRICPCISFWGGYRVLRLIGATDGRNYVQALRVTTNCPRGEGKAKANVEGFRVCTSRWSLGGHDTQGLCPESMGYANRHAIEMLRSQGLRYLGVIPPKTMSVNNTALYTVCNDVFCSVSRSCNKWIVDPSGHLHTGLWESSFAMHLSALGVLWKRYLRTCGTRRQGELRR